MDKNIESVEFILENCESLTVPNKCFKSLHFELEDLSIKNLRCIIKDDGDIKGGFDKFISPIQRLNMSNDITSIIINHKDGVRLELDVEWYDDNKNTWLMPKENKGQTSKLISYNEIYINIELYMPTYSLNDLAYYPKGPVFEDDMGNKIKICEDQKGRYIDVIEGKIYPHVKYKKVD